MRTSNPPITPTQELEALVPGVVAIAREAGDRLLATFSPANRVRDREELLRTVAANEDLVEGRLRDRLAALRPDAAWLDDERGPTAVPDGAAWVVDCVEGNVNHVHGLDEWCVTITLLADGEPVLAMVHQPVGARTATAIRGGGAWHDGRALAVSAKRDLAAAIAATGQAEVGQRGTYARMGESITAMLGAALLVRASVPSTFPLLLVATGQHDVFWQHEPTLAGVAAGALLVAEAGGVVSGLDGSPWRPGGPDVLAAAPGVHRAAVDALTAVG